MLKASATLLVTIATFIPAPACIAAVVVPAGTALEARLSVPTGSRISHEGDVIQATIIAPVFADHRLLIPQGAIVSGAVERVERVGLGLEHRTSGIEYRFNTLQLPDRVTVPIDARVIEVETAKERVNAVGMITGIHPTANLSSTVAFYAFPLLCVQPEFGIPMLGIKFVIARSPDPEIYFPAGTEMILQLRVKADIPNAAGSPEVIAPLSTLEMARVHQMLAQLPQQRTRSSHNGLSDRVNFLILGSRDAIDRAFRAAGWFGAQRKSMISAYHMYHCIVQRIGYSMAPMAALTLNGMRPDAEYQKSLDTFSKRHHLRLWKQGQEDAWFGAAIEDIGYTIKKMHPTHATDPLIDNERAKVVNDLAFTGCVDAATLVTRDSSDSAGQPQTSVGADGKIAVIHMTDCQTPRTMPGTSLNSGPPGRGRFSQVMLALRNDLIRTNPISLVYNSATLLREHRRGEIKGSMSALSANQPKPRSSETTIRSKWIRPSVLDATSIVQAAATAEAEGGADATTTKNDLHP